MCWISKCQSTPSVIRQPSVCSTVFPLGVAKNTTCAGLSGSIWSTPGAMIRRRTPESKAISRPCSPKCGLAANPGQVPASACAGRAGVKKKHRTNNQATPTGTRDMRNLLILNADDPHAFYTHDSVSTCPSRHRFIKGFKRKTGRLRPGGGQAEPSPKRAATRTRARGSPPMHPAAAVCRCSNCSARRSGRRCRHTRRRWDHPRRDTPR